jgi:probable rRNA maturation factor
MLRVAITDERAGRVAAPRLAGWLARVAPARVRGSVSVAIVSDRQVRALNRTYRGIDRPTDVLSFPATTRRARASGHEPPARGGFLGDVVIANGVAGRQARAAGHSRLTEFRVLALHGLLHLLGYDHDRAGGPMARVERRLRRKGGLREGLIERADPSRRSGRGRR